MTDDEVIKAVTARLVGEFCAGQRVLVHGEDDKYYEGTVTRAPNVEGVRLTVIVTAAAPERSHYVGKELHPLPTRVEWL